MTPRKRHLIQISDDVKALLDAEATKIAHIYGGKINRGKIADEVIRRALAGDRPH